MGTASLSNRKPKFCSAPCRWSTCTRSTRPRPRFPKTTSTTSVRFTRSREGPISLTFSTCSCAPPSLPSIGRFEGWLFCVTLNNLTYFSDVFMHWLKCRYNTFFVVFLALFLVYRNFLKKCRYFAIYLSNYTVGLYHCKVKVVVFAFENAFYQM